MPDVGITPSNKLEIKAYFNCGKCLEEYVRHGLQAKGESPQTYSKLSIGYTDKGIQVWCYRHDVNVANIDFEGHKHPGNITRDKA